MSGSSLPLVFDFGTVFKVTETMLLAPELPVGVDITATTGDVDVGFTWTDAAASSGSGLWSELFTYKSSADDFVDTLSSDIDYGTNTSEWFTDNLMTTTADTINGKTGGSTIAKEMLLYVAETIFGKSGSMDMFQNEEDLLSAVEAKNTALTDAIDSLLNDSNTNGTNANREGSSNFAYQALTRILASGAGDADSRATDALTAFASRAASDTLMYVPFIAGDKLIFSFVLTPSFNADGGTASSSNHGIGINPVAARTYKVTLTLA